MLFLLLASIFICSFLIYLVYKHITVCKAIILGTTNYFFTYVLISAGLIWLDVFSVLRTVVVTFFFLTLLCLGMLFVKGKKKAEIYFDKKELIICLSVLFLAVLVSGQKFGFFGMGQDQGVYQTKAIEFIYDQNQNQYDFEEYALLNDQQYTEEAADYKETIKSSMVGFYLCSNHWIDSMTERSKSDVDGIYHGIPTFPALLALFGKLFGISHMMDIQTVFFFLFLMGVYYILENFHIHTLMEVLSIATLMFSSEIIWVSKSSLTEIFICVITCTYIRLLTDPDERLQHCSLIPILVFAFYHVTIFTMVPLFAFLYFIKAFWEQKTTYVWDAVCVVCEYLFGYAFMVYIEPQYTMDNYVNHMGQYFPFITHDSLNMLVLIVCICALAVCAFIYIVIKFDLFQKVKHLLENHWLILYKFILAVCLFGIILKVLLKHNSLSGIGNIGLAAFAIATGITLLPLVLFRLLTIAKTDKVISFNSCSVWVFFLYAIVMYSLFFKWKIEYFYYYGRYITPYLFIIVVAFCTLYSQLNCRKAICLAYIGGVIAFAQSDYVLFTQQDDTKLSMNVLEDILNILDNTDSQNGKSAVVVSDDLISRLALPLKACGNDIYFEWDTEGQESFLSEHYDSIYYCTTGDTAEGYDIIYKNINYQSEDDLQNAQILTQYPTKFVESQFSISVYQLSSSE